MLIRGSDHAGSDNLGIGIFLKLRLGEIGRVARLGSDQAEGKR
jgi:hypothetical protein